MKLIHVTDLEIQQYVFENTNCTKQTISHIEHCDICKAQARAYLVIVNDVKQSTTPAFDFNLSKLVLSQLPVPTTRSKFSFSFLQLYIIAFFLLGLLCSALFFLQDYISSSFKEMKPAIYYGISLITVTIVMSQGIDMFKKYQAKMTRLNHF